MGRPSDVPGQGEELRLRRLSGGHLSVKLGQDEAAVVASDPQADPTGYGLGRHGWIAITLDDDVSEER